MVTVQFLFGFLLLLAPGTLSDGSAATAIEEGDTLFHALDNAGALRRYEIAYAEEPKSFAALLRLSRTHSDIGFLQRSNDSDAEFHVRKALAFAESLAVLYPEKAETEILLAVSKGGLIPYVGTRAKIELGKVIRQHAREAIRKDSTTAIAYVILANFERETSRLSWFEKMIANIVFGGDISGSLEKGKAFVEKALALEPENPFALYEYFKITSKLGDTEAARSAAAKLLQLSPASAREAFQKEEVQDAMEKAKTGEH